MRVQVNTENLMWGYGMKKDKQGSLRKASIYTVCMVVIAMSACTESDIPKVANTNNSDDYPLTARVVRITPDIVEIEYTLSNNTANDRIIFSVGENPLSSMLVDGNVRLFKGQYDPGVTSVGPLLISGQLLRAGESITESATRPLPVTIDFSFDVSTTHTLTSFEFCIGHGDPSDQGTPTEVDNLYGLSNIRESSENECMWLRVS